MTYVCFGHRSVQNHRNQHPFCALNVSMWQLHIGFCYFPTGTSVEHLHKCKLHCKANRLKWFKSMLTLCTINLHGYFKVCSHHYASQAEIGGSTVMAGMNRFFSLNVPNRPKNASLSRSLSLSLSTWQQTTFSLEFIMKECTASFIFECQGFELPWNWVGHCLCAMD